MSTTGEGAEPAPAAEQPAAEVTSTEEKKPEEGGVEEPTKVAREKKPPREKKAPKEKKPKDSKTSSHPPYFQMIKEALLALQEKSGSSAYAIAKYMEERHKGVLPANFKKMLSLQLKNCTARGKLIKIKASFKLPGEGKKGAAPRRGVKKPEVSGKATSPAKRVGARRTRSSAGTKPKQPKSIKSPAAKKAKRATAG